MQKYMDEEIRIPVLSEGDKLYHYTSAAGLKGIVGKEFWITEAHFLNDSTEFQIGTEVFIKMLQKHIWNQNTLEKFVDVLMKELHRLSAMPQIGEKVAFSGDYVLSFSMDDDSTLMWAEYSDFMGYCMKFDFQKLLGCFGKKQIFHGAVVYDFAEQMECVEETFKKMFIENNHCDFISDWRSLNYLNDNQIEEVVLGASVICEVYNMFFKKACFSGEHEYRFVFFAIHDGGPCKGAKRQQLHFRIKDEVLIPYIKEEISCLECLEAVLVGPKNKSDIAIKGLEYFFRNEKLNVEVKKSEMPLRY